MTIFANALEAQAWNPISGQLAWLAGLLEAEGTFLRPPPSMPNCPIVACRMTDRDVVGRVAACFGTKVMAINKGRYRTEYAATLKGARAVAFMSDIKPLMGERRQAAIEAAILCYSPPKRKLDFAAAEQIRHRFAKGESVSSLARFYEVAPQTIRPILQGRIYHSATSTPWRRASAGLPDLAAPSGISPAEFYWLTGWLEGEGSFLAPPPSDPRRPRISAQAKDQDVVAEAARLCRVTPSHDRSKRILAKGWSPTWKVLVRGARAITFMLALKPGLGARRRKQIESALSYGGHT